MSRKVDKNEKKSDCIKVRVSKEDKKKLDACANWYGFTRSDFIRKIVDNEYCSINLIKNR